MKFILFSLFALWGLFSPQQPAKAGFVTSKFTVYGNCGMCKTRIEKALKVKGVKYAYWDKDTELATVKHDPKVVSLDQLHQLCAAVGHDTDLVKAKDEVYNQLHSCCKYDRKP